MKKLFWIGQFKKGLIYPNVTKAGGLQSQGVKGEVVVVYLESLTTQDLKSSGFPVGPLARGPKGQQSMAKSNPSFLSRRSSKSEVG
jgi:hypothetical protein